MADKTIADELHEADECRAVSPHGDVCVRAKEHDGLCRSGIGRKHVSSPEKAGKPWYWYRADARVLNGTAQEAGRPYIAKAGIPEEE